MPLVHDRVPIPFASDVAVVMAGLVDAHGPKEMSAWMLTGCGMSVIPGVVKGHREISVGGECR